jgi:DNA replication protein DnaC
MALVFPGKNDMIKLDLTVKERNELVEATRGSCNICNGKGYTLDGQSLKDCGCIEELRRRLRYIKTGIYPKYWDWVPDEATLEAKFVEKNPQAISDLQAYGSDMRTFIKNGTALFIWGGFGTGKTAFSMWLVKQALTILEEGEPKYACGVMTLRELVQLLGETNDAEVGNAKRAIVDAIEQLDLVVIDEFDKEYATGTKTTFSGVAFGDIFNLLYNAKKAMIVLSNSKLLELQENGIHTLDVLDRLSSFDQIIELTGSSYRKLPKRHR